MHGGEINLDSKVGKGSTFSFTLPVTQTENQLPAQSDTTSNSLKVQTNPDREPTSVRNSTHRVILAIDKDPKLTDVYRRYLAGQEFNMVALTELDHAISMAREIQPFAITLDVSMQTQNGSGISIDPTPSAQPSGEPVLDGWKVLEKLKTNPETQSIPVIVCTMISEKDRALRLGANAYLFKPILQEDLIRALKHLKP
jgi:CheY-like chemotaxis protein